MYESRAKSIAKTILATGGWSEGLNYPPGMIPGSESPPEQLEYSTLEVYEAVDPAELDQAMKEAIEEGAFTDLTAAQIEELAAGGYYSPVSADVGADHAVIEFRRTKPVREDAPERFTVTVRNPFAE